MGSAVEVKGNKQRVPVWGVLATVCALTSVKLLYHAPNDLFVSLSLSLSLLCFAQGSSLCLPLHPEGLASPGNAVDLLFAVVYALATRTSQTRCFAAVYVHSFCVKTTKKRTTWDQQTNKQKSLVVLFTVYSVPFHFFTLSSMHLSPYLLVAIILNRDPNHPAPQPKHPAQSARHWSRRISSRLGLGQISR